MFAAAMIYVAAFASFWPACAHCLSLGPATAMAMSVDDMPCAHDGSGQSLSDCAGLSNACLNVDRDKAEAAQFTNPVPVPLAAALIGGPDHDPDIYLMRRSVATPFHALDPPPAVPHTPVALKTLFRN